MFPPAAQRAVLLMLLIVAGVAAHEFGRLAFGGDHNFGYSLLAAPSPAPAVGLMLACGLLLAVIGWLVAASGNPLAGPFVLGGALAVPAILGGSIDGWMRQIDSPSAYFGLAAEAVLWMIPVIVMGLLLRYGREGLRRRLPGWLRSSHYVESPAEDSAGGPAAATAAGPLLLAVAVTFALQRTVLGDVVGTLVLAMAVLTAVWAVCVVGRDKLDQLEGGSRPRAAVAPAFLGGVVCISFATMLLVILLRDADVGQVTGAMLVSFALAALAAHQIFPSPSRLLILLCPLVLAVAAYAWTAVTVDTHEQLLQRFFTLHPTRLNPLATALPIFYASAGVVGAAVGIGWSQSIHASRDAHVTLAT